MARATNRLTARGAATLTKPGLHADGNGLYLKITLSGSKSWTMIYRFQGKRTEIGLGALPPTTLAQARDQVATSKALLRDGIDPKAARRPGVPAGNPSFGTVATELIDGIEAGWRNPKHRQQWRNTLQTYAAPIWTKDVAAVDANDLVKILQPIWRIKPETASRVRGRIERVLDAARVRGLRAGDNPARWRGNLSLLLSAGKGKGSGKHHAAMPFGDVPPFMARLRGRPALAARALELTILTAARTGEMLGARWSEFDLDARLWTVPAERMKAGKEHRVPLSVPAIAVLTAMQGGKAVLPGALLFAGTCPNRPLSNMCMAMLLRRMKVTGATVHGFRSSFRDWVGETTAFPREVAEAALAHAIGSEVERAYRRGDALNERRKLMAAWADFLVAAK
jgi:integrase